MNISLEFQCHIVFEVVKSCYKLILGPFWVFRGGLCIQDLITMIRAFRSISLRGKDAIKGVRIPRKPRLGKIPKKYQFTD
ncbi:UNVERIFIED_CONTAM: hypothetical protein PYX00_000940 [Menopon gallinae]|uniref:Ribosomal protein S13 n=1 Tax=Menopon gallinae TaxID=328185 RepID=A0AAW2IB17_9NEOP